MNTIPLNSSADAVISSADRSFSAPNQPATASHASPVSDGDGVSHAFVFRLRFILAFCIGGIVLGIVGAAWSMWIPSNRIVVFKQPYGNFAVLSSIRIARPGFIVLNFKDIGGWRVEQPYYLDSGYYRDLLVPVDFDIIRDLPPQNLLFVVRMYVDDGDGVFDAQKDMPVRNVFGRILSQDFYMLNAPKEYEKYGPVDVEINPFGYIYDSMFP